MNNGNQKKEKNQPISVYVRVRPMNRQETQSHNINVVEIRGKELTVKNNITEKYHKSFVFDKIFGPESKQIDVFKTVAEPAVAEIIAGYNCTIFAYGQTGTGKTYTMAGGNATSTTETATWREEEHTGIIPRTLSYLFDELRVQQIEYTVRVSYLELYNEEIFDLLSPPEDTSKLKLYDDMQRKGSVIVQGLTEVSVSSKAEVYKILESGAEKRRIATTLMNANSSRSHTIFSVTVHTKESSVDGEDLLKIGKLNLVDLAGSENISKSGSEKRARETSMINTSLLTLGRVIVALTEHTRHIPYRESKLTRLLRDSLGGKTKTSLIATVSPALYNLEETLNTLDYASRAKHITNKPEMNQRLTKNALLKDYEDQIMKLQKDLQASRLGTGVYIDSHNYEEMIKELTIQKQEISDKINYIRALKEEMDEKEKICNELKMEIQQHQEVVEIKTKQIGELESKLDQASTEITKLEEEKEEKEFLVAKHSGQEKIIHITAVKLLDTVETSTQDNEKLHRKLDVIADLNKYNKSVYEQSISDINSKTRNIQNRTSEFHNDLNKFHQNLKDNLNQISSKRDEVKNLHNGIVDQHGELWSRIDLLEGNLVEKQNQFEIKINSIKEASEQLKNDNSEVVQESFDNKIMPHFEKISKHQQLQLETTKNVVDSFKNVTDENSSNVQFSIQKIESDVINMKNQVHDNYENLNDRVSKAITNLVSFYVDEQETIDKQERDLQLIMNSVRNMYDVLEQRKKMSWLKSQKVFNNLSMLLTDSQNYKAEHLHKVANALESIECISDALETTDAAAIKLAAEYTTKCEELRTTGNSINETAIEINKNLISDVHNKFTGQNNLVLTNLDAILSMSSQTCSFTNNTLRDIGKQYQEQEKITNEASGFNNKIYENMYHDIDCNSTNSSQFESHLNIEFEECREHIKKLFTTNIKEYKPTGYTPIRKKYKYPKNVPPAINSEEILEDFRKTKFQIPEENDENGGNNENECNNDQENINEDDQTEKADENKDPNLSDKIEDVSTKSINEVNEEIIKKKTKILSDNSSSNIPLRQKIYK